MCNLHSTTTTGVLSCSENTCILTAMCSMSYDAIDSKAGRGRAVTYHCKNRFKKKNSAVLHQCGSLHLCSLGSDTRLQRDTGNKWLSSTADGFFLGTSASKKHFIWIDLPLCESDSCKDAIRVSHIAILTRMLCVGPKDSRTWLILCFFLSCYVLELWLRV